MNAKQYEDKFVKFQQAIRPMGMRATYVERSGKIWVTVVKPSYGEPGTSNAPPLTQRDVLAVTKLMMKQFPKAERFAYNIGGKLIVFVERTT